MKMTLNFKNHSSLRFISRFQIAVFLIGSLLLTGCSDKDDDIKTPEPQANVEVQDYIWKGMNLWYFWQASVSDLADTRFANLADYIDYLQNHPDPESFFYDTLLSADDEFSYITDDYQSLLNSQQGNTNSNGVEFGLSYKNSNSNEIFGWVRYIVKGSDAANKDISRGDIFTGVDGQTLTVNNYIDLLYGDNNNYTLNMADLVNGSLVPNGKNIQLTKTALTENPVFIAKTLDVNGQKVGYLMYNQFTANFDSQLNDVFTQFKSDGITDLVLDMRYNPGGSVNSAVQLSSMITGQFTGQLFIKQRWNSKIQSGLPDSFLIDNFTDKLSNGTAISSLKLNRVYVLALSSSASASELVMNGLAPYIDVIHIGTKTRGKNEFSITLLDDPENDFLYSPNRLSFVNKNHSWGMQPLVGRNENAAGFSDYKGGLVPDIELREDLSNLGTLGDVNEPLLAKALQQITGSSGKFINIELDFPIQDFSGSNMLTPIRDNMYLDKELKFSPSK